MRNISNSQETIISPDGIETTIFGSILNPLVSSSKNRNSPALDAGNGAPFFSLPII